MRVPPILVAASALLATPLSAQNYAGTYTTTNDQGGVVTLTLAQGPDGAVSGTLVGNGNTFQVDGMLEGTSAVGTIINQQIGVGMYFQADFAGAELVVILVGVGADNQPDYSQRQEVRFARRAGGVAGVAAEAGPPGPGPAAGGRTQTGDPWSGTWVGGDLRVTLQRQGEGYAGTATVQGTSFPLTGRGGAAELGGTYSYNGQQFPWQARLQGHRMTFLADGQTVQLERQGATASAGAGQAAATAGSAAGPQNVSQLSPQGREWYQWLVGKRLTQLDSYYSGPSSAGGVGGGYSSRKEMDLCTDGRFFYTGSDVVGAGGAGVSGYSGGNSGGAGRWRVIEQGSQVGLELTWQDGSVTQHLLEYNDQKTFIDGERTFVTQDNQACR